MATPTSPTVLLDLIDLEIGALASAAKIGCKAERTNASKDCETYFANAINAIEGWNLEVAASTTQEGFDLIDIKNKIVIQVTSQNVNKAKIEDAINGTFAINGTHGNYKLIVLFLSACDGHSYMKQRICAGGARTTLTPQPTANADKGGDGQPHDVEVWITSSILQPPAQSIGFLTLKNAKKLKQLEEQLSDYANLSYESTRKKLLQSIFPVSTLSSNQSILSGLKSALSSKKWQTISNRNSNKTPEQILQADLDQFTEDLNQLDKYEKFILAYLIRYSKIEKGEDDKNHLVFEAKTFETGTYKANEAYEKSNNNVMQGSASKKFLDGGWVIEDLESGEAWRERMTEYGAPLTGLDLLAELSDNKVYGKDKLAKYIMACK